MRRGIKIFAAIFLCLAVVCVKASAGAGDCFPLRSKQKVLQGSIYKKSYELWDIEKSNALYKVLLEHTAKHPHFLRMGMAIINKDLLLHQHREAEIYYFLGGKGTSYLGRPGNELKVEVQRGTLLYIPAGLPHYTKAQSGHPLEFLYVFPRYGTKDIEYVYDGTLASGEGSALVREIATSPRPTRVVHRENLVKADLLFDRMVVPGKKWVSQKALSNTIVFVHTGRGTITVDSQKFRVEQGTYLLIPQGRRYTVEGSEELDLFFLGRGPGKFGVDAEARYIEVRTGLGLN